MRDQIVQGSTRWDFTVLPAPDSTLCSRILELLKLEDAIEGWRATPRSLVDSLGEQHPKSEIERAVELLRAHRKIELLHDGRLVIAR